MSRSTVRSASRLGPVGAVSHVARGAVSRAAVLAVIGVAAAALVAGCGAGQLSQTARKESAIQGVNADLGPIKVRNAHVEFPPTGEAWEAGADVPLAAVITNQGATPDELVSVSSDLGQVRLVDPNVTPSPSLTVPLSPSPSVVSPSVAGSPSETASPSATPPPAPTASAAASTPPASPSVSPSGPQASLPLAIPPGARVSLGTGEPQLVLTGAREEIAPGDLVQVTMTFRSAGEVTLNLPMGPPATPQPRESLTHEGEESEAGE